MVLQAQLQEDILQVVVQAADQIIFQPEALLQAEAAEADLQTGQEI
jgi:hypothetical protein